jgi:hypothetical protein
VVAKRQREAAHGKAQKWWLGDHDNGEIAAVLDQRRKEKQ